MKKVESDGFVYSVPEEAVGKVVVDRSYGDSAVLQDADGRRFRVYGKVKATPKPKPKPKAD